MKFPWFCNEEVIITSLEDLLLNSPFEPIISVLKVWEAKFDEINMPPLTISESVKLGELPPISIIPRVSIWAFSIVKFPGLNFPFLIFSHSYQ